MIINGYPIYRITISDLSKEQFKLIEEFKLQCKTDNCITLTYSPEDEWIMIQLLHNNDYLNLLQLLEEKFKIKPIKMEK